MSRTRCWTILLGTEPTAFRAEAREDLVPTLKQLQRRHPEAVIKWFERGQLFESEEAARAAAAQAASERRPRDWRPGGDHRDPRARFEKSRDEKRRLYKTRMRRAHAPSGGDAPRDRGQPPDGVRGRRPPERSGRKPPNKG